MTDTLLFYGADINADAVRIEQSAERVGKMYEDGVRPRRVFKLNVTSGKERGWTAYEWRGLAGWWRYPVEKMERLDADGILEFKNGGCFRRVELNGLVPGSLCRTSS